MTEQAADLKRHYDDGFTKGAEAGYSEGAALALMCVAQIAETLRTTAEDESRLGAPLFAILHLEHASAIMRAVEEARKMVNGHA